MTELDIKREFSEMGDTVINLKNYKTEIKESEFADIFWKEFSNLVPEHLRPRLSCHHIRFMIKAFLEALKILNN